MQLRSRLFKWIAGFVYRQTRPSCTIEVCNLALVAYDPNHKVFIRQYYLYCVELFKQSLSDTGLKINVVFGDYSVDFGDQRARSRIDIQYEHTLVKPGGRDGAGAVVGNIPIPDSKDCYLARVQNYSYLERCDLVIEYSLPNIMNLQESKVFDEYLAKTVYISPFLYDINFRECSRNREIATLFADVHQPRRSAFLERAKRAQLPLQNVKGTYDKTALQQLYRQIKILVNVHQTPHHHTFEELRILPALLCGVVIVSEEVPLKEYIPYSKFIVWSGYKSLIDTVHLVHANYEKYYSEIFNDPELQTILNAMRVRNIANVHQAVQDLRIDSRPEKSRKLIA